MLPEPSFRVAEPWAGGLHESPEADRVVWLAQVHQLVNEDVFADFWRHEQETVVERDVAAGRAGTPARKTGGGGAFRASLLEPPGGLFASREEPQAECGERAVAGHVDRCVVHEE